MWCAVMFLIHKPKNVLLGYCLSILTSIVISSWSWCRAFSWFFISFNHLASYAPLGFPILIPKMFVPRSYQGQPLSNLLFPLSHYKIPFDFLQITCSIWNALLDFHVAFFLSCLCRYHLFRLLDQGCNPLFVHVILSFEMCHFFIIPSKFSLSVFFLSSLLIAFHASLMSGSILLFHQGSFFCLASLSFKSRSSAMYHFIAP